MIKVYAISAIISILLCISSSGQDNPTSYPLENANKFLQDELYEKAIEYYDQAIKMNKSCAEAWNGKGLALAYQENYEEALACYQKAIEINPLYVDAWNNMGWSLEELIKYEEAIECYDKAIKIDPNNYDVWNNKGISLFYLKRYDDAIKCYKKSVELNPSYGDSHWNLAHLYKEIGLIAESEKEINLANQIPSFKGPKCQE
jgi:tetratricopeptide (TPR) repeat protein